MCGPYGHGWWWNTETADYAVVTDLEVNSHSRQRKMYSGVIPESAHRWGFNILDLKPITNDDVPLPDEVAEKITRLLDLRFPDINSIAKWIRANYAANKDRDEWDWMLPSLVSNLSYFSPKRCTERSRWYAEQSRWCTERSEWHAEKSKRYAEISEWHAEQSKRCAERSKRCAEQSKRYAEGSKSATGTHDTLEIDSFLEHFLSHPNDFWAQRKSVNAPEEIKGLIWA